MSKKKKDRSGFINGTLVSAPFRIALCTSVAGYKKITKQITGRALETDYFDGS